MAQSRHPNAVKEGGNVKSIALLQEMRTWDKINLENPKGPFYKKYAVVRSCIVLPLHVNIGFQVLFHSPPGVLFTFPSQYCALSVTE